MQDDRRDRVYLEWQTKSLARVIAAAGAQDKKHGGALEKLIETFDITSDFRPSPEDEGPMSIEEQMETAYERALVKNKPGSFERLMGGISG